MPKKKASEVPAAQVVFRLPRDLHDALQTAATGLGLDLSNLLRMMIAEHVPEYIERGRRAAVALGQARAQAQEAATVQAQPQKAATVQELAREAARQSTVAGRRRRSIDV